ncbi:hypothetical protein HHI36_009075 [Cryptolaemus montrouzieri]|uniref:Uncharacterized protein n=1 Tax=Cryptolaemus montrouzieri TaxID=559131 RepID=A0ABD2MU67_9CUCU
MNVVKGFKATGTRLIDRNIFQYHHFAPALVANVNSAEQNDSVAFSSPTNMQYMYPPHPSLLSPSKLDEFKSTLNILSPLPWSNLPGKSRGVQQAVELTSSPYKNGLETSQQKVKHSRKILLQLNKPIK